MTKWLGLAIVAAVVAGVLAPPASAAPFTYCWLEASTTEGSGYTTGPLAVLDGQTIYYRIQVKLADPSGGPIINNVPNTAPKTMTSLLETVNGINAMKFSLYELAANPIQADFATAATLATGWSGGTGPSPGTPTTRTGNSYKDLKWIRPIQVAGTYVGVSGSSPVTVLVASGSAVVHGSSLTTDSYLKMSTKTPWDAISGTNIRMNGSTYATNNESTLSAGWAADPTTVYGPVGSTKDYDGLVLYTPWADADQLNDPYAPRDPWAGQTLALDAATGGSSHTTVNYDWTISSAGLHYQGQHLVVPAADLMTLGPGLHHVLLEVTTGDGHSDSEEMPLMLTPEPATMALLGLGGLAIVLRRRQTR